MTSAMIPLSRAYLCADCDTVGANSRECVRCGSQALYLLSKLLNREASTAADEKSKELINSM